MKNKSRRQPGSAASKALFMEELLGSLDEFREEMEKTKAEIRREIEKSRKKRLSSSRSAE